MVQVVGFLEILWPPDEAAHRRFWHTPDSMTFVDSLGAVHPWNRLAVRVVGTRDTTYTTWNGATRTEAVVVSDTTVYTRPAYPTQPGLTFIVGVDFSGLDRVGLYPRTDAARLPRTPGYAPGHPLMTRAGWGGRIISRHEVRGYDSYTFRWPTGYGSPLVAVTVEGADGGVRPLPNVPVTFKLMRQGWALTDLHGSTDWNGELGARVSHNSARYAVIVKGDGLRCPASAYQAEAWAVLKVRCVEDGADAAPWYELCKTVFGDWYMDDRFVSRCTRYDG